MALIPWTPFWPWEDIEKAMDDFSSVPAKSGHNIFPVDVFETDKTVEVRLPIAGMDPERIDVSVEDNLLTVRGETEKKTEVEDKDYYRKEIRSGTFHRTLPLPANVVGDKASAASEKGMLKISVPKAGEKKGRKVKVEVKSDKGKSSKTKK